MPWKFEDDNWVLEQDDYVGIVWQEEGTGAWGGVVGWTTPSMSYYDPPEFHERELDETYDNLEVAKSAVERVIVEYVQADREADALFDSLYPEPEEPGYDD